MGAAQGLVFVMMFPGLINICIFSSFQALVITTPHIQVPIQF